MRTRSTSRPTKDTESDDQTKGRSQNVDYLSIFDITREDITGTHDHNDKPIELNKFDELMLRRDTMMNEETRRIVSFGQVRLDSDNVPKSHGHYDPNNRRMRFNIEEFEHNMTAGRVAPEKDKQDGKGSNIFEDQYFDSLKPDDSKAKTRVVDSFVEDAEEYNFIDRQYFADNPKVEPLIKSKINFKYSQQLNDDSNDKLSDTVKSTNGSGLQSRQRRQRSVSRVLNTDGHMKSEEPLDLTKIANKSPLKSELFFNKFETSPEKVDNKADPEDYDIESEINQKIEEQKEIKLEEVKPSIDKYSRVERTGAQYLEDLKSGKDSPYYSKLFTPEVKKFQAPYALTADKLDSKGFRVLSGQVFDFSRFTNEDIVELLLKSVLFNDTDILAINKPYGMVVHSKESKGGPALTQFLPDLCRKLDCENLYTVHRLDRDTTGILLLAKSQEQAKALNAMFAQHQVIKRYFCITRGVPDEPEGVIDIPIEIGHCGGVERMVLRPEALQEYQTKVKPSRTAKRAVTQYKVMASEGNAALIEVWPQTGVRHQIRVHLGFGLRCPILGDHKYSHLDSIAPQKLTSDMLKRLNVRQAKVRHIPMHLHARQYCLTSAGADGRNIFINAPFPHHFHQNMSRLRIRY